jgi:hypothetical protein
VKERFARGDNPKFLAWASEAFGWSPATIYRYIEIFEFMRTGNFLNLRKLDLDLSSLYLLIAPSTTDEARAEVVKQAKTKKLAHADVKKTVARHAKAKAKKAAPADAVVLGTVPFVEEAAPEPEPHYIHVRPDAAPPIVHVDVVPGDVMVEHLHDELAARNEEIDDLRSTITDLRAEVIVQKNKIAVLENRTCDEEIEHLKSIISALKERVKFELDESADEFAAFLLHYCGRTAADIKTLMAAAKEFLPYVFEALERAVAEPEPAPATDAQTWDQFVATYRATETPLPENHPKLIAGMVAWADENDIDVEQLAGAPKEAVEIWTMTAKNFRGQTVTGDSQRETTAKILQRFGDERRHSIAAMASSLSVKEKFLAGVLDMMLRADFKGMVARDPDGKSWKYTIRRPAKEKAQ